MITLNANALCSRNEVKDFLQMKAAGNDIDDFVNQTINRISTLFESWCHRQFMSATYTEYFDGGGGGANSGGSWLFPNVSPIISVTSIFEDDDWVWGVDDEIDSVEYRVADGNSIFYDGIFTNGPQSVRLIYVAGYTSDTIPEDLKQAAIVEVARIVKHRTDFDVLTVNRDDGTVQYTQYDFLPLSLKTLYRYRITYVA